MTIHVCSPPVTCGDSPGGACGSAAKEDIKKEVPKYLASDTGTSPPFYVSLYFFFKLNLNKNIKKQKKSPFYAHQFTIKQIRWNLCGIYGKQCRTAAGHGGIDSTGFIKGTLDGFKLRIFCEYRILETVLQMVSPLPDRH